MCEQLCPHFVCQKVLHGQRYVVLQSDVSYFGAQLDPAEELFDLKLIKLQEIQIDLFGICCKK